LAEASVNGHVVDAAPHLRERDAADETHTAFDLQRMKSLTDFHAEHRVRLY
jgi:hypothetical protein